jgi:hypothetical protein
VNLSKSTELSKIKIVSSIIGSGLIVFLISSIYSDFIKQPLLNIEMTNTANDTYDLDISNSGSKIAHNVTVIIRTSFSKIFWYNFDTGNINHCIFFDSMCVGNSSKFTYNFEKIEDKQPNNQTLVFKIPKLSPKDHFTIMTVLDFEDRSKSDYIVNVISDEESVSAKYYVGSTFSKVYPTIVTNLYNFSTIIIILIISSFAFPVIYNLMNKLYIKYKKIKYIHDIYNEIKKIIEGLEKDSKDHIFHIEIKEWISKNKDFKMSIFSHYYFYSKIDKFYANLSARQNLFMEHLEFNDSYRKNYDENLVILAKNIIEEGKEEWKRYLSQNHAVFLELIFTFLVSIPAGIFVIYTSELSILFILNYFPNIQFAPDFLSTSAVVKEPIINPYVIVVIIFLFRSITSFFVLYLLKQIFPFFNIKYKADSLFLYNSKLNKIILSFFIMGFPLWSAITLFNPSILNATNTMQFIAVIIFDITRFFDLILFSEMYQIDNLFKKLKLPFIKKTKF